ncbi:1-acyl-sn-glycerol-3-phosphate acyltransferase [Flammeovirga sp. SubArs3]|uniref:1-acyl-sn-glycerol-3-phosphate acyltransferase n=1 Tax=Flammeovirga sp. SubArs3 TaxID=2995316 RepID=UPI00248C26A9|nr:1-acyl-sn-glycerol-3-phosphate acyltransferase [Flammeovirga sp. SubArs3]
MKSLWVWLFKLFGWKIDGTVPEDVKKCVVVVGPHTSFWDFLVGVPARELLGFESKFFIKSSLCVGPLGWFLLKLGAIPVHRKKGNTRLVDLAIEEYNKRDELIIAVTPEGTRSYNPKWRTGFYHIANGAKVPIVMAGMCFKTKRVVIGERFIPTGNVDDDIVRIKRFFYNFVGKHPEKGIRKEEIE